MTRLVLRGDTRTIGAKLATAAANLIKLTLELIVVLAFVAIPVGIVVVVVHFIGKYW